MGSLGRYNVIGFDLLQVGPNVTQHPIAFCPVKKIELTHSGAVHLSIMLEKDAFAPSKHVKASTLKVAQPLFVVCMDVDSDLFF